MAKRKPIMSKRMTKLKQTNKKIGIKKGTVTRKRRENSSNETGKGKSNVCNSLITGEGSSAEDDLPLAEIRKRLRAITLGKEEPCVMLTRCDKSRYLEHLSCGPRQTESHSEKRARELKHKKRLERERRRSEEEKDKEIFVKVDGNSFWYSLRKGFVPVSNTKC